MPIAAPEIQAFANGFPIAMLHWAVALVILIAGIAAYGLLSPHRELAQARDGNAAAAVSLGAAILTLAIPLAAAVSTSASTVEVAIWGISVMVLQLLLSRLTDMALRGLPDRIAEGDVAAAWLLACAKGALCLVLAAAVAG
jgi:putative membrane protein